MPLHPRGAGLALALAFAAVLLWAFDRYGLAALLVAAVSSALLRDALVACLHLEGNLLPALLTVGPLVAVAAAGAVGLSRPERDEEGRLDAPGYVRRLESERRVKYEMDLLSRMQLSLLPEKPPVVPGLELSREDDPRDRGGRRPLRLRAGRVGRPVDRGGRRVGARLFLRHPAGDGHGGALRAS